MDPKQSILKKQLKFPDIVNNLEKTLNNVINSEIENIDHIYEIDNKAREAAIDLISHTN